MAVEQNNRTPAPAAAAPVAEEAPVATPVATPAAEVEALEPPPEDGHVEVDNFETDSAYGGSNSASDWTSVSSSIYKGVIENGRRYQSYQEGEYWQPADEQQFESMANTHVSFQIHDHFEENPFFRSPIGEDATSIIDIGTGGAEWAIDVADRFPNVMVHGIDLFPPRQPWVPPNCILEVDDATKPWLRTDKFDLVHMRFMTGSFTDDQWREVYRNAYKNLKPGGWLEHVEFGVIFHCDDDSIAPDSVLGKWGPMFIEVCDKIGKRLDCIDTMREYIEEAGFVNIHEKNAKFPHGTWPRSPLLKEVGRCHLAAAKGGLEGYALFLLTKFGLPEPWSYEEVQVHLAQVRQELDGKTRHAYSRVKRIWCQKPLDATD